MKKRRGGDGGGEGSWLNTYADMVTLLLCFFVLLYAISSVDQVKWEILVKSLNPNYAKEVSQIVTNVDAQDGDFDVQGTLSKPAENTIENFDDLYYTLVEAAGKMGLDESDVQIQKSDTEKSSSSSTAAGTSSAFITFQDRVFFRGDDSSLTENGKLILKTFSEILGQADDLIGEIDVLGHTSQGDPKRPNNVRTDFTLSALRSMEVIVFLASQDDVRPNKFVGGFFGQHKSVAGFDTAENRSKNRRVEILILRKGTEKDTILNQYYDKFYNTDIRNTDFIFPDDKADTDKTDEQNAQTADEQTDTPAEVTDSSTAPDTAEVQNTESPADTAEVTENNVENNTE